jgi:hypothetical protein
MPTKIRIAEFVLGALCMLAAVSVVVLVSPKRAAVHASDGSNRIELQVKDQADVMSAEPAGSERAPVFVRIQKGEKEAADEKSDREKKETTDWLLATYTGLLFLATLGLMVATAGLWYFAVKQSRDMRESLAVAAKSSDAAKSSADVANRTFTQIERPYVFVAGIGKLLVPTEPDQRLHVMFGISNLGRTPAFVSELYAELYVLPNPIAEKVKNLPFSNAVHRMGDVLASGEKLGDIVCFARADASLQLEKIKTRGTYLIFKVAIIYSDIFGGQHYSNLHWLYDPDRDYFSSYTTADCNTYN